MFRLLDPADWRLIVGLAAVVVAVICGVCAR